MGFGFTIKCRLLLLFAKCCELVVWSTSFALRSVGKGGCNGFHCGLLFLQGQCNQYNCFNRNQRYEGTLYSNLFLYHLMIFVVLIAFPFIVTTFMRLYLIQKRMDYNLGLTYLPFLVTALLMQLQPESPKVLEG